MKKWSILAAAALLSTAVIAAPFTAEARSYHDGGHYGPRGWQQSLPEEKMNAYWAKVDEHREKMRPLYDQLWTKRMTLDALKANPKVEPKELTALVGEISTLRAQVDAERRSFAAQMRSEFGMDVPGSGRYGDGHRRGYRHDGPRGYGPCGRDCR